MMNKILDKLGLMKKPKEKPKAIPNTVEVDAFSIHRTDYEIVIYKDLDYFYFMLNKLFDGNFDVFHVPTGERFAIAGEVLYSFYPDEKQKL